MAVVLPEGDSYLYTFADRVQGEDEGTVTDDPVEGLTVRHGSDGVFLTISFGAGLDQEMTVYFPAI